ncbi:MAG: ABC transporter ATP-binding protein [Candidatus Margulisiibacteriota bacterium]
MNPAKALDIENLKTYYYSEDGNVVKAVDGVSLCVSEGEFFALTGPSGCGKSTIGFSILRLIQSPGKIISGKVLLDGRDLLLLPERDMRRVRGTRISMIFQDPFTSLNPVLSIGEQVAEAPRTHFKISMREALEKAEVLLKKVKIDNPALRMRQYPHQLSGGQRQRVMIAIAISCGADFLIADEPTTALDVSTQAGIMELLQELRTDQGLSVLFISHNIKLAEKHCKKIAVMSRGRIIQRLR